MKHFTRLAQNSHVLYIGKIPTSEIYNYFSSLHPPVKVLEIQKNITKCFPCAALEADAQSPVAEVSVDNIKDEFEDGIVDVDVKEEPFSYDDKVFMLLGIIQLHLLNISWNSRFIIDRNFD